MEEMKILHSVITDCWTLLKTYAFEKRLKTDKDYEALVDMQKELAKKYYAENENPADAFNNPVFALYYSLSFDIIKFLCDRKKV